MTTSHTSPDSTSLAGLGTALRRLQDAATTTSAPAEVVHEAAAAMEGITALLAPFAGELGTEHDFEHYVASSGAHTLNPELTLTRLDSGELEMSVRFGRYYRNAFGYVNGGAIALMFDTAIAHLAFPEHGRAYTASLSVAYRSLAPVETELRVALAVQSREGRKMTIAGALRHGDILVAEVRSLLIAVRPPA